MGDVSHHVAVHSVSTVVKVWDGGGNWIQVMILVIAAIPIVLGTSIMSDMTLWTCSNWVRFFGGHNPKQTFCQDNDSLENHTL